MYNPKTYVTPPAVVAVDNDDIVVDQLRVDFPVDEVTVSVDEETGKSVFIDRDN